MKSKLNLRRRKGQKIVIGDPPDDVVIIVREVTDHDVTLSIQAPASIPVDRYEIAKAKGRI